MKKIFTLTMALLLSGAIASTAQSKINAHSYLEINNYQQQRAERVRTLGAEAVAAEETPMVGAIVSLTNGSTAESLRQAGYEVTSDLGDMAIVSLPVTEVEAMAELPQVSYISLGKKIRPLMNKARKVTTVDNAQKGIDIDGTTRSFNGEGVVVGMFDVGFQANHINFLDSEGNPRVKRLWVYSGNYGSAKTYSTPSNILAFTTDSESDTHGTHTVGIMAGSYNGTGRYVNVGTSKCTTVTGNIPYYGIASGAEIAASAGDSYDTNILAGMQKIIDYAQSEGKPAVINLSLGSNSGPHDGTESTNQALTRLGKSAIVCMSSGNEGDYQMSIEKTFENDGDSIQTLCITSSDLSSSYGNSFIYGYIDVWASDNQAVEVTLGAYRTSTKKITTLAKLTKSGDYKTISSTATGVSSGSAAAQASIDSNNKRYECFIQCNSLTLNSSYRLCLIVKGKAGQTVNIYADGGYFDFRDTTTPTGTNHLANFTAGNAENSINNMACADNIISVGSFVSSRYYGILDNSTKAEGYSDEEGSISSFSSYGKFKGQQLPHVITPGSLIVSSYSKYYIAQSQYGDYEKVGEADNSVTNEKDYWGVSAGTSMASPQAAGVVALWLQADPTLDFDGIIDVLKNSCKTDEYTAAKPEAAGYGKIDAEAGLRYILQDKSAIGKVFDDDNQRFIVTNNGSGYDVTVAGDTNLSVSLYDLQGRPVVTTYAGDGMASISTADLTKGVYVLAAEGSTGRYSRRVLVK